MKLGFIGDVHGHIMSYSCIVRDRLNKCDYTFQLGDVGLGFSGVDPKPLSNLDKKKHRFIRGNHDDPKVCREHPNYLGDYGYLEDLRMFYVGGGFSIDKDRRIPGISWWADEELSHEEMEKAKKIYEESKPVIVISHECPHYFVKHIAEPHSAKWKGSKTAHFLNSLFDIHKPSFWYFGHYHKWVSGLYLGTHWQCLPELGFDILEFEGYSDSGSIVMKKKEK